MNRVVEGYTTFRRCGIDVLAAGRMHMTKRPAEATATIEEAMA